MLLNLRLIGEFDIHDCLTQLKAHRRNLNAANAFKEKSQYDKETTILKTVIVASSPLILLCCVISCLSYGNKALNKSYHTNGAREHHNCNARSGAIISASNSPNKRLN